MIVACRKTQERHFLDKTQRIKFEIKASEFSLFLSCIKPLVDEKNSEIVYERQFMTIGRENEID